MFEIEPLTRNRGETTFCTEGETRAWGTSCQEKPITQGGRRVGLSLREDFRKQKGKERRGVIEKPNGTRVSGAAPLETGPVGSLGGGKLLSFV